jgi:O-antigen/teichoic acid export membrane protein
VKALPKNILSIGLSEALSRLLGFFTTIYLARVLDVKGFGMINIGLTVFAYALLFGSQWLNLYGTRKIAAGENNGFVKNFLSLRLIFSFSIAAVVALCSVIFIKDEELAILIYLFALSVIPNAINLDWYFQGRENLFPISFGRVLTSVGYLALLVILFSYSFHNLFVPVSFFVGNTLGVLYIWFYFLRNPEKIDFSFSIAGSYGIFTKAFRLSFASVLTQVNVNIPILAISMLMTVTDVGVFSAASKLVFFLLIADRLLYSIYFPVVTRIFTQTPDQLSEVISFVIRISLVLVLPVAVICVFMADDLINLIYGTKYLMAATTLKILVWYFCVTILNSILGYALVAINKEKIYSKVVIYSTPIFLLLILMFTFLASVNGVAFAVVLYELMLLSIFKYYLKRSVSIPMFGHLLKIIPALVFLAAILIVLQPVNILLSLIAGFVLYFLVAYIMKAVSKSDLKMLKEKLLWN